MEILTALFALCGLWFAAGLGLVWLADLTEHHGATTDWGSVALTGVGLLFCCLPAGAISAILAVIWLVLEIV